MVTELAKIKHSRSEESNGKKHNVEQKASVGGHGDDAVSGNKLYVQEENVREGRDTGEYRTPVNDH